MEPSITALVGEGLDAVGLAFGSNGERHRAADIAGAGQESYSTHADAGAVGVVMTNDYPTVEVLLGAIVAGARLVSLPLPSRGCDLAEYVDFLRKLCAAQGVAEIVVADDSAVLLEQAGLAVRRHSDRHARPLAGPTGRGFELVQCTSGATGPPKPVALSDAALGSNVAAILNVVRPRPGDNVVSWLPLAHDMGLVGMFLTGLAAGSPGWTDGGNIVLLDPREFLRRPADWLAGLEHWRGTFTAAPDFAFRMATRQTRSRAVDLAALRCVIVGGEIIRTATLLGFAEAFAENGFDSLAFCPAYGMAELGLAATLTGPDAHWHSTVVAAETLGPDGAFGQSNVTVVACGSPLAGYDVRTSMTDGGAGRVDVRGPSVAADGLTGRRLVDDEGWHRTGDLGFVDGGELHLLGRADDYVVAHGQNLHAPTLEAQIGSVPGVRDGRVVVAGLPNGEWVVVAERVDRSTISAGDAERLRREIRQAAVAAVGARPDEVVLAERGSVPLTSSGKLQRAEVRARLLRGEFV